MQKIFLILLAVLLLVIILFIFREKPTKTIDEKSARPIGVEKIIYKKPMIGIFHKRPKELAPKEVLPIPEKEIKREIQIITPERKIIFFESKKNEIHPSKEQKDVKIVDIHYYHDTLFKIELNSLYAGVSTVFSRKTASELTVAPSITWTPFQFFNSKLQLGFYLSISDRFRCGFGGNYVPAVIELDLRNEKPESALAFGLYYLPDSTLKMKWALFAGVQLRW